MSVSAMDNQAQLVVRDQESFLFLETPSKKLLLPSTRVKPDEDFAAAAQRCITEVRVAAHVQPVYVCTSLYGRERVRVLEARGFIDLTLSSASLSLSLSLSLCRLCA